MKGWLRDLPSQNFTVVVLAVLWGFTGLLLGLVTVAAVFLGKPIPDGILALWAPWMAGIFGGGVVEAYRFKAKRETTDLTALRVSQPPPPLPPPDTEPSRDDDERGEYQAREPV